MFPRGPRLNRQLCPTEYLSGTVRIVPTRWVFGGRCHCCVICSQCVSQLGGGGGYVGYIQKALEKGYLEHPGLHAVLTTCLRFWSVLEGSVLLAASLCQQAATMSAYKFTPRAIACPCLLDVASPATPSNTPQSVR